LRPSSRRSNSESDGSFGANFQQLWPGPPVDAETDRDHVVYELGPALPMAAPLRAGPGKENYRASRPWVLVDELLTVATLKDAIATSKAITGATSADEPI
jgi:hypothetical protein